MGHYSTVTPPGTQGPYIKQAVGISGKYYTFPACNNNFSHTMGKVNRGLFSCKKKKSKPPLKFAKPCVKNLLWSDEIKVELVNLG